MTTKQELGQFFTTNPALQNIVYSLIHNNPSRILEPSMGKGHLIEYVHTQNPRIKFDAYEIDESITPIPLQKTTIKYEDFLTADLKHRYSTIIGNPPFVKKPKGNLYINFIQKCFHHHLKQNGELIFIVPSDFFKLTSSANILFDMQSMGTFTHIIHPHDERMFKDSTIDIIIFRYVKDASLPKEVLYNDIKKYIINNNGLLTFSQTAPPAHAETFDDYFDIYVGMVSGRDSVFKHPLGNIEVLTAENTREKYIFTTSFPHENDTITEHLEAHKSDLLSRRIRKFDDNNWFEWGAPRNIKIMEEYMHKPCIYIHTLTRKDTIAFQSTIEYFGGTLIMLKPKCKCNLKKVVKYLNSDSFKSNFTFSGRFKIGQRQLRHSPFNFL
jgi:adenine-specific DNA-methyltransferase